MSELKEREMTVDPEYRCPCRWCQHIREQNADVERQVDIGLDGREQTPPPDSSLT